MLVAELLTVGVVPDDVADDRALDRAILEELAAVQIGMLLTKIDQLRRELEQALARVVEFPVVPGQLIVLAISVVVARSDEPVRR